MTDLFKAILDFLGQFKIIVIVLPWEVAVRTRLGKHTLVWQPGWHVRLPFVDDVQVVNTRLRVVHASPQTVTTKDGKQMTISFVVGFSIAKPLETLQKMIEPETTLVATVQSVAASFVWEHAAAQITIEALEDSVRRSLFTSFGTAIVISWVRVSDFVMARTYRIFTAYSYDRTGTAAQERKI